MLANCWMAPTKLEVREVPDPKILNERDAIVRITSTAICGSDLHLYHGMMPDTRVGHTFPAATCSLHSCSGLGVTLMGRKVLGEPVP